MVANRYIRNKHVNIVMAPHAGKYGSNIHPAFWRNTPFLLLPVWGAILLFSRERELPIIPADKVRYTDGTAVQ